MLINQNELFANLTAQELLLTQELSDKIIRQIKAKNGHIPFSQYMHLALYEPQLGYYNNLLHKFGRAGDFITSPSISKLFGNCLAKQIKQLIEHGTLANILEVGAGNGQLMLDILANMGNDLNHYYILELSANLIYLQQQQLLETYPHLKDKVVWLTQLPSSFCGVILANEVLDAQPCEIIRWKNGNTYARHVAMEQGRFVYQDIVLNDELKQIAAKLPGVKHNYISEINLNNRGFIKTLANSLTSGAIILIDYGYGEKEYYHASRCSGTLRGFFRHHQLDEVLVYPGLVDITASVDFSAVVNMAISQGLEFIGYTTQANFLLNCGILEMVMARQNDLPLVEYLQLTNQVNQLILPNKMGEVFKVVGFTKKLSNPHWLGFTHGDCSHTL